MIEYFRCGWHSTINAAAPEVSLMDPYNMNAYLITMGAATLVVCALFYYFLRKAPGIKKEKALGLGLCVLILGPVLAIVGGKLLYFIFRMAYVTKQGIGKYLLSFRTEEMSYYGAMAGVVLAVFLSAKICGADARRVLNTFAPAGALMAAIARFAEYFLYPTGTGLFLDQVIPFPLAVSIVWSEDYTECVLAVFFFEGVASLAAFVLSLVHKSEPRRLLRTLFYLCLPQVLLESLRTDAINLLFVHLEQLLCFLFVEGVFVWYAFRLGKNRFSSWVPAIAGVIAAGLIVVMEFLIDGKLLIGGAHVSPWITYPAMAAVLAVLAVLEHRANRRLYSSSK